MMKLASTFLFLISSIIAFGQAIDDEFSRNKMKKDLEVFKEIRLKANSGLYKYRTKEQIDSIYIWAENEINKSSTYLDFYNIVSKLTDFEGSTHNDTDFPAKYWKNLRKESYGYFPYPIKWIDGKWRVNFDEGNIPLGAEIISINQVPISKIMDNLYQYFTTDGINTTGKRIGLRTHFARYYRWYYGLTEVFEVEYCLANSSQIKTEKLKSVSSSNYYKNFKTRYSKPYNQIYFADLNENKKYKYEQINGSTGILTIHTFDMGNENTKEHKKYCNFLDSVFSNIKTKNIDNLIVDVRRNGGGTDPNDVITYSYLASRKFQESKQAWISFNKVPLLKYYDSPFPAFLRPLGVGKFNRNFQKRFPNEKNGKYFISKETNEMKVREPNKNAFTGTTYLLISPRVASAGSLFAAMLAGNDNTITIGEETMGGFYGHNGHTEFGYVLPKSKIVTNFYIENIEQDVAKKSNQIYGRGIIPDFEISQTYKDFLKYEDTQLNYVLELIKMKE